MFHKLALFSFLAPSSLDQMVRPASLLWHQWGLRNQASLVSTKSRRHSLHVIPRTDHWRYPAFGSIVDTINNHLARDRARLDPGQHPMVYTLQEGFIPEDRFWIQYVRKDRMRRRSSVLYRSRIVNDLVDRVEELFTSNEKMGLMVRGPHGIGKSFSLINLTRYLLASGKYLVTIIPDGPLS